MKIFLCKHRLCRHCSKTETSKITYIPNAIPPQMISQIQTWLETQKSFSGGTKDSYRQIPREQIWFDKQNRYFGKNWKNRYQRWEAHSYPPFLIELEKYLQTFVPNGDRTRLNSCLVNLYRNQNDSIRKHCDSPDSFGTTPTILVLSIGVPRRIVFTPREYNPKNHRSMRLKNDEPPIEITLESGSLLIMSGGSQKYFCHEIPKERLPCGKRYSLTFREYLE